MSHIEERLKKMAERSGQPIPDRIKNKPSLRFGLQFFFDAFFMLDTERQIGMSVGMVPWSAIHNYCLAYNITGELYEDLLYFIPRMDAAYLSKKQ